MPLIAISTRTLSDLAFHELDPTVGYSRQKLNVTPAGVIEMGTVVFRAKDATNTDATAYTVLTAAAGISVDNEYAVVFGDHYDCKSSFTPRAIAADQFNAVAFVGKNGGLQLKDWLIREAHSALTEPQFQQLREILASQGIIVEVTLGA